MAISLLNKAKGVALNLRHPKEDIIPHDVHMEDMKKKSPPKEQQLDEMHETMKKSPKKLDESYLRASDKKGNPQNLVSTSSNVKKQPLARGVSGLPMSQTPALSVHVYIQLMQ